MPDQRKVTLCRSMTTVGDPSAVVVPVRNRAAPANPRETGATQNGDRVDSGEMPATTCRPSTADRCACTTTINSITRHLCDRICPVRAVIPTSTDDVATETGSEASCDPDSDPLHNVEKPPTYWLGASRNVCSGGVLLSHTLSSAVPSAQVALASGFGMGPGVPPPL